MVITTWSQIYLPPLLGFRDSRRSAFTCLLVHSRLSNICSPTTRYSRSTNWSIAAISRSASTTKHCMCSAFLARADHSPVLRYDISMRTLKVKAPTFPDLNGVSLSYCDRSSAPDTPTDHRAGNVRGQHESALPRAAERVCPLSSPSP